MEVLAVVASLLAASKAGVRLAGPGGNLEEGSSMTTGTPVIDPRWPGRGVLRALASLIGVFVLMFTLYGAASASTQIPFKARQTVTDVVVACPSLCFQEQGSGTAALLGRFTSTGSGTATAVTPLDATHLTITTNESHMLTAANGDTVTLAVSSNGIEDLATGIIRVVGTYTVTGGTGRFTGATGTGEVTGILRPASALNSLVGTFTWAGTISSVG
jgi:hypothetical protein